MKGADLPPHTHSISPNTSSQSPATPANERVRTEKRLPDVLQRGVRITLRRLHWEDCAMGSFLWWRENDVPLKVSEQSVCSRDLKVPRVRRVTSEGPLIHGTDNRRCTVQALFCWEPTQFSLPWVMSIGVDRTKLHVSKAFVCFKSG